MADRPVAPDADFRAEGCEVTVEPYGDHAYLVTVDGPRGQEVVLRAAGWRHTVITDLVAKKHLPWRTDEVTIRIPADRAAWLMAFRPPPEVSIFDYRPQTLLRTPGTSVTSARFPVIDVHAHLSHGAEGIGDRLTMMDALNVQAVVTSAFADRGEDTSHAASIARKAPGRIAPAATIDWSLARRPGGGTLLAEKLEREAGQYQVVMVGEMHDKGFGVDDLGVGPVPADPVFLDDPRLDPVWDAAASLGLPVIIHCGEDLAAYEPWDDRNESLARLYQAPWERRRPGGLSHPEVHRRRDNVLERFPSLAVIAAHLDCSGERLELVDERLRRHGSLYLELGVMHRVLARQPRFARGFLDRWRDRVMFGGDQVQDQATYQEMFRVLESADDAFSSAGQHDQWPLYGLDLPDPVLRAVYHETAQSLMPALAARIRPAEGTHGHG